MAASGKSVGSEISAARSLSSMDAMAGRGERVTRQDCDGGEEKAGLPLCGTRRVTDAPVTCVTHASV